MWMNIDANLHAAEINVFAYLTDDGMSLSFRSSCKADRVALHLIK